MSIPIDVMIVGAQKAGTTSLLRYLGEHPECISHPQKEFSFFTDDQEYNGGLKKALLKFFSHRPYTPNTKMVCKNASLYAREYALQRLQQNNPKCEIVYIMRNPVERTYSSYLMEKNAGSAKFEFYDLPELMKNQEKNDAIWGYSFFIDYSIYVHHLKTIYKYFPKEQVNIILYEDLKKDASSVCKQIFKKIGVDEHFEPNIHIRHNETLKTHSFTYARIIRRLLNNENPLKKVIKKMVPGHKVWKYGELLRETNKTKKKHSSMNEEVRQFLINFYKVHNDELALLINKDLSDWNK